MANDAPPRPTAALAEASKRLAWRLLAGVLILGGLLLAALVVAYVRSADLDGFDLRAAEAARAPRLLHRVAGFAELLVEPGGGTAQL